MTITHERVPCCAIEDKYIDALVDQKFSSVCVDLSVMLLIERYFSNEIDLKKIAEILQRPEIEIECSIIHLININFLKKI